MGGRCLVGGAGCSRAGRTLKLMSCSEDHEEALGTLLGLREALTAAPGGGLQVVQEEARRLMAREEAPKPRYAGTRLQGKELAPRLEPAP